MDELNTKIEEVVDKAEDVAEVANIVDENTQLAVDADPTVSKGDVAIYIAVGILSILGITKLVDLIKRFFRSIKKKIQAKRVAKHPEDYESAENYVTEEEAKKESEAPEAETASEVETPQDKDPEKK